MTTMNLDILNTSSNFESSPTILYNKEESENDIASYKRRKIKGDFNFQSSLSRDIDEIRQEKAVYEYLCRLEEARLWIQECIQEKLPRSTELEERLRNGVYFAKLGNFITPHVVPLKKIFDIDEKVYKKSGLHYRHTDNINYWISAMKAVGLPSYFYPNSFDVYGKKNMPKAIYCLHALSLYLHRCGKGMKIIDLMGKIQFSDEEINAVSAEFKKFGIQLPAFSKIGGILAYESTPHDATLHAAIIAINISICQNSSEELLAALLNPNAQLRNVLKENAAAYKKSLLELKSKRKPVFKDKKKHQMNWDFLTHRIIQEEIDSVNIMTILNCLKNAALSQEGKNFVNVLKHPVLNISNIVMENADAYLVGFKEILNESGTNDINIKQVQSLVSTVNYNECKRREIQSAIDTLNNTLESNDYFTSFNFLKSLTEIPLHDMGRQFYHTQFINLKKLKGRPLDLNDISVNLPIFTALLDINVAIIECNVEDTFTALSNSLIKCWELNANFKNEYFDVLKRLKSEKCLDFLSVDDIIMCIEDVNNTFKLKEMSVLSTKNINNAISLSNSDLLINSLLEDPFILCINTKRKDLYFSLLEECKVQSKNKVISHEEICQQINKANKLALEAEYNCAYLASINMAVDKSDPDALLSSLKTFLKDENLCSACKEKYLCKLAKLKKVTCDDHKQDEDHWICWEVSKNATFYLNLKTLEKTWNLEGNFKSVYLNKEDVFFAIAEAQNECPYFKSEVLEAVIVPLQSHIRGFLLRQHLSEKKMSFLNYSNAHTNAAIKMQSFVRMTLARKKYLMHMSKNLRLHSAARIIQKFWRAFKVNQSLNILARTSNPPVPLMQKIIYMLEISNDDYSEEFKLHSIKGKAVQSIRYNQSLLREIDEVDIKIGLLIRNRITLEDLLKQKKRANSKTKREVSADDIKSQSYKLFSKEYNTLIEWYENLLYLLQIKPIYLSRLIISLPTNQATSLIESVIFSLYNFGSTPREEYLLLKMLSLTLEEDIKLKGHNLSDIIKGENIIMKIIISFYRKNYWRENLKTLLQPLVTEVLADKSTLCIPDPVEIYKVWLNEIETQTGIKSSMPYEVTVEDALYHPEVYDRFNLCIENLLKYSCKFCNAILNGQSSLPYGILYMCKVLKSTLQEKYPASSTEELNNIVGNFLYYRYINPAIVAPDVFDIITTEHNEKLADFERLKLSAIAKFLHLSVTGRKYSEEAGHLMCLNPYIVDCHELLTSFFEDICKVESLEEHFNIDVFSEALVNVPEVYMSLKELQTLYDLIRERENELAPDSSDVLHKIIADFKSYSFHNVFNTSESFLSTEICLALKSKYDLHVEVESDEEKLYTETKFMLIVLLQVVENVDRIPDLFERELTMKEEMRLEVILKQKYTGFSYGWMKPQHDWGTLSALVSALETNLCILEEAGFVSSSNDYQEILNDIAKEIVNRWRYRISRKQDIFKLMEIQKQLDRKTLFYLEKLDYYNKYIASCLENMKIGKQGRKQFFCRNETSKQLKHQKTIKCSGSKLHEKGIIIEIKDLEPCQYKNVSFEISPTEDLGVFTVNGKFMGTSLKIVDIDIQDLLDRQYQGIAEMDIFDCVKINNNLLLHFLNRKFYGKNVTYL